MLNEDGDFDGGDIILGGDGDDVITGRGGDDIIDGDKWLNVRISVRENADGTGDEIGSHDSMKTLVAQVFSGAINPGQLKIVREIVDTRRRRPRHRGVPRRTVANTTIERFPGQRRSSASSTPTRRATSTTGRTPSTTWRRSGSPAASSGL